METILKIHTHKSHRIPVIHKYRGAVYQDGNDWLELISGSESNVVGLPLEALAETLVKLFPR